jgi:hypothetical protein
MGRCLLAHRRLADRANDWRGAQNRLSQRHNLFLAQKHFSEPLMIIEPELSL